MGAMHFPVRRAQGQRDQAGRVSGVAGSGWADSLSHVPHEDIYLDRTLEELDDWTNAHCADPYDEPYLDANLNPITPEQLLEHIRKLEGETGEQMIFRHDEQPGRAA